MGRPKTWSREDAVRKAMTLFWERGYEGTHLRELIDATGVNRFSLYKEFGGKEGLYLETLRTYVADLERFDAIMRRAPLGVANIRDCFRALAAYPFPHGCFALNTLREKHVVPQAAFALVRDFARGLEDAFLTNLRAAAARGELAPGTDVVALARLLAAVDIGFLSQRIVAPEITDREAELALLDRLLR